MEPTLRFESLTVLVLGRATRPEAHDQDQRGTLLAFTEPANERANAVLSYWFGDGWAELGQTGIPSEKMKLWFSGDAATDQASKLADKLM